MKTFPKKKRFPTDLTFDQFKMLAGREPDLSGNWIYRLVRTEICERDDNERDDKMYPKFDVWENLPIWFLTFKEAEQRVKEMAYTSEKVENLTYCFHIVQYPVGIPAEHGARWLYDRFGNLVDYSITCWTGDILSVRFFGRPAERQRFKRGDIVEVLTRDGVALALLVENSPSVDWCWEVYQRCLKSEEDERLPYFLDASDDCCYLIDGPGHEYHSHVSPLLIMKPRFTVSEEIEKEMKSWLNQLDK